MKQNWGRRVAGLVAVVSALSAITPDTQAHAWASATSYNFPFNGAYSATTNCLLVGYSNIYMGCRINATVYTRRSNSADANLTSSSTDKYADGVYVGNNVGNAAGTYLFQSWGALRACLWTGASYTGNARYLLTNGTDYPNASSNLKSFQTCSG